LAVLNRDTHLLQELPRRQKVGVPIDDLTAEIVGVRDFVCFSEHRIGHNNAPLGCIYWFDRLHLVQRIFESHARSQSPVFLCY